MDTDELYKKINEGNAIVKFSDLVWGTFKLGECLGKGANCAVYEAEIEWDSNLDKRLEHYIEFIGKHVAVKLPLNSKDDKKVDEFKRETNIIIELNNPLVVRHYNNTKLKITTPQEETIDSIILRKYCGPVKKLSNVITTNDSIPDNKNVLKLFNFLIEILELLHKHNIVHRDIKIENILVDPYGNYALADFEIAVKIKNGKDTCQEKYDIYSQEETPKGSKLFCPPEQMKHLELPDYTMDIFTMGHTVYFFSTNLPHRGTKLPKIKDRIINKLVSKCLRSNKYERFQSIRELKEVRRRLYNDMSYVYGLPGYSVINEVVAFSFPEAIDILHLLTKLEDIEKLLYNLSDACVNIEKNNEPSFSENTDNDEDIREKFDNVFENIRDNKRIFLVIPPDSDNLYIEYLKKEKGCWCIKCNTASGEKSRRYEFLAKAAHVYADSKDATNSLIILYLSEVPDFPKEIPQEKYVGIAFNCVSYSENLGKYITDSERLKDDSGISIRRPNQNCALIITTKQNKLFSSEIYYELEKSCSTPEKAEPHLQKYLNGVRKKK